METPSLRVRLEFGDRSILSKPQRSDGMNKSWLLLKLQQHRTISDVCTHLLHIFKLHRSCPNGILLSMEGFVLPPFESTEILKDKELICVKKKGGATPDDAGNLLDEVEADDLEPGDNGLLLLANDKGDEEFESESEEVDEEQSQDEEDSPEEEVSKKRKAPIKLQNSRNKRRCLGVSNDVENEAETHEFDNVKNAEQANQVPAPGGKKMPSRSARRKKAKRKWMQELAKISKKKPQQPYSKPEVTKPEKKDTNGQPKGLLHWKQASQKPVHKKRVEQANNQNGDVAVVNKPGHIRFENFDEDQHTPVSNETYNRRNWNGSNGKKKGQRWGTGGKYSSFQRNDSKRILDKKSLKISITDMQVPVIDPDDFNKLPPCCEPKEGDVIAYRLLELNSSWIPEFSSFRVGRISYYDARDIVLIPVPEYPIVTDKMDENRPNDSLYREDGTLEINYSALLDVCYVKQYDPEANKETLSNDNGAQQPPPVTEDNDAADNLVSNNTTTNVSKDSNTGDGPWDHFSKNTPLPDVNHSSGPTEVPDGSNKEDSDKGKGIMGNNNPEENQSSLSGGWTIAKKVGGNDCGEGSSWGRPWSSFQPLRVNVQNRGNDWGRGGNGRPWSRGRRGRGRNQNA